MSEKPTQRLQIYDLKGSLLLQGKVENNQIDISALKNGIYMLELSSGDLNEKIRFVKE